MKWSNARLVSMCNNMLEALIVCVYRHRVLTKFDWVNPNISSQHMVISNHHLERGEGKSYVIGIVVHYSQIFG